MPGNQIRPFRYSSNSNQYLTGILPGSVEHLVRLGGIFHAVVAQITTDQLPHHLGGRQVLGCAQMFEGLLLVRVDQQREARGFLFHWQ